MTEALSTVIYIWKFHRWRLDWLVTSQNSPTPKRPKPKWPHSKIAQTETVSSPGSSGSLFGSLYEMAQTKMSHSVVFVHGRHLLTSNLRTTSRLSLENHISSLNILSQTWHTVTNPRLHAQTFGFDIGIVGIIPAWRRCKHKSNPFKEISKTTNTFSILVQDEVTNWNSFLVALSPYFSYMAGGSSVIDAVFASSTGIRQSKLCSHPKCERRGAESFLWCVCSLVNQNKDQNHLGSQALESVSFSLLHCALYWPM